VLVENRAVRSEVKRVIESGYDAMADRFAEWQREIRGSTQFERVEALLDLLPSEPDILELGVGAGVPSTRLLAARGRLTGVDLSREQLRRARERIPHSTFVQGDLSEVAFEPASFDAVVAAYVLNHVPQEELGPVARRVAGWLRPGGYFLGSFGTKDNPGWTGEWLGVEMFFAGLPPEENRRLVEDAGLEILHDEIEVSVEPDDGDSGTEAGTSEARFQWLLARKPE
jgi:predicted TPR repeat methyltransferase